MTRPTRSLVVTVVVVALVAGCGASDAGKGGGGTALGRQDAAPADAPTPADAAPAPAADTAPATSDAAPAPAPADALADAAPGDAPPAPPAGGGALPTRLVVLGDSIAACTNIGQDSGPDCGLRKLYDYVKASYAPALVYDNQALGGAVTGDVPTRQLPRVKTGPGHVLVVIYVGGNDLSKYMFAFDPAAERGFTTDLPAVKAAWDRIFEFFQDRARFPDGVTVVMNNQYNPFDDCSAAPYFISAKKHELLARFNQELAAIAAAKGARLTDQYTPYRGHGHHYNVARCPHYAAGATPFMDDLIHPNAAGHDNLFQQWKRVVDQLYRP
jgi:lysophospholipase L1-like esterase